jgi:DNA-directed RNA polymerase specialized sigma subunit
MISKEEILRIASDYQKTALERIDQLLKEDANSYTNLGINSTKTEKEEVKKNSRAIYKAIKDLDEPTGRLLLQDQDGY